MFARTFCANLRLRSEFLFNKAKIKKFSTGFWPRQENSKFNFIKKSVQNLRSFDEIDLSSAELNWSFLLDKSNRQKIETNNKNRKGVGDIHQVNEIQQLIEKLYKKAVEIPNNTHDSVPIGDYDKCITVFETGEKITKKTPTIDKISKLYGWLKEDQLASFSTQRAYILKKELADLEKALITYTLKYLNDKGFILVSVPDILHHSIIESCGFPTKGYRNQVYKLDYLNEYGKYCLSGTSEMALAGYLKNKTFNESELPLKFCAVSRCFRAEVSGSEKEGKLYRLHEFTKVEMFILSPGDTKNSNQILEEIKSYQIDLFSNLGLHFRVLEMSTQELGSPAYRKYDIEAWMPGNQFYGEISSTSNCTDYQSRRLHIKSSPNKLDSNLPTKFVHTLNGTACAIPRMLTSIIESNWDMKNKQVVIPEKLRPYMNNQSVLKVPEDFRKTEPWKIIK